MAKESWGRAKKSLEQAIGHNNYRHWIEPLRLIELRGSVAVIGTNSAFHGNWVERNYGDHIQAALRTAGLEVSRLDFRLDQEAGQRAEAQPAETVAGDARAEVVGAAAAARAAAAGGSRVDSPAATTGSRKTASSAEDRAAATMSALRWTRSCASTPSSSASPTSWPMPPRAASPKAGR